MTPGACYRRVIALSQELESLAVRAEEYASKAERARKRDGSISHDSRRGGYFAACHVATFREVAAGARATAARLQVSADFARRLSRGA